MIETAARKLGGTWLMTRPSVIVDAQSAVRCGQISAAALSTCLRLL